MLDIILCMYLHEVTTISQVCCFCPCPSHGMFINRDDPEGCGQRTSCSTLSACVAKKTWCSHGPCPVFQDFAGCGPGNKANYSILLVNCCNQHLIASTTYLCVFSVSTSCSTVCKYVELRIETQNL